MRSDCTLYEEALELARRLTDEQLRMFLDDPLPSWMLKAFRDVLKEREERK